MADAQVFEETFQLTEVNSERYDRVSRIFGTSLDQSLTMTLDINHELFPCHQGESIQMVLATTLNLDGTKEETSWRNVTKQGTTTLADMYDYVCYGKNYRFEDGDGDTLKYFASFGGLLLYIEGPFKKLTGLKIDNIYMLLKRS